MSNFVKLLDTQHVPRSERDVSDSASPHTSVAALVSGKLVAWIRHMRRIKGIQDSDT